MSSDCADDLSPLLMGCAVQVGGQSALDMLAQCIASLPHHAASQAEQQKVLQVASQALAGGLVNQAAGCVFCLQRSLLQDIEGLMDTDGQSGLLACELQGCLLYHPAAHPLDNAALHGLRQLMVLLGFSVTMSLPYRGVLLPWHVQATG